MTTRDGDGVGRWLSKAFVRAELKLLAVSAPAGFDAGTCDQDGVIGLGEMRGRDVAVDWQQQTGIRCLGGSGGQRLQAQHAFDGHRDGDRQDTDFSMPRVCGVPSNRADLATSIARRTNTTFAAIGRDGPSRGTAAGTRHCEGFRFGDRGIW
jgi:hypothetical protein